MIFVIYGCLMYPLTVIGSLAMTTLTFYVTWKILNFCKFLGYYNKFAANFFDSNIQVVISLRDRFFLSSTLFCWGCRGLNVGYEYQFWNIYEENNYWYIPLHYQISMFWSFSQMHSQLVLLIQWIFRRLLTFSWWRRPMYI